MDYVALRIDAQPCTPDITDLIAAILADVGYESFLPDEDGLTAYIRADDFNLTQAEVALEELPIPTTLNFSQEFVKGEDWNAEWEKNYFKPIIIADKCVVHSSFHTDLPKAEFDIVIDPKMAFGTGHHATTNLILSYLLGMDLKGRALTDVGTGTGILAILAAMKGAAPVSGIEIDNGAFENAVENAALNNVDLSLLLGDASLLPTTPKADVLLANINRNIITRDLPLYVEALKPDATVILSGFYTADIPIVEGKAKECGLTLLETRSEDGWAALRFGRGGS